MKPLISRQKLPLVATIAACLLLYVSAGLRYPHFFGPDVALNFLTDNAVLGITALGLTFVILSGGIDLSVGSAIGCTSILLATLIEQRHWAIPLAIAAVLAGGTLFGWCMGALIRFFDLPPFLITLAGLFFYRGLGLVISTESISITQQTFLNFATWGLPLPAKLLLSLPALIFLVLLLIAIFVAHFTSFGRNTYALGGSEPSALLMGLPVGKTKISLYALSGFCAALAGIVNTIYTSSGNATAGTGMELDAIAAVVVGGTLLAGGTGYVFGTLLGVLIFGIIQTAITFEGTLSSWWTRIAIGLLLLIFIILQRLIQRKRA